MQNFIHSALIALFLLLTACGSTSNRMQGDTTSLAGLQSMANVNKGRTMPSKGRIREMALKEIALSLGAQSGLSARANLINAQLTKQARRLDTIYDFNSLILEHNILPPVLLEGRNTLNLADTQNIRISDRTYKVAKQARFITAAPTWRQYLWMDYKKPDFPHVSLLPKTSSERAVWRFYVEKGWNQGVEQANTILEDNIGRIREDFGGMILYRKLLAMNMVSAPFVSHTDLGVTGDASEIHIDDRVLRITALPALNVNSKEWKAALAKDEDALTQLNGMEKLVNKSPLVISNRGWQPIITPGQYEQSSSNAG
jgi:defect-in-organelle-trafficking protein DotC